MNVGVCLAWWMIGCSEEPIPRLLAHLDRDSRAEGQDLLPEVDHKP